MGYIGENSRFSFRDGFCEPLSSTVITSSDITDFGRSISQSFRRVIVGCESEKDVPFMYALCSGISEGGADVYVCRNTDMPSFLFGISVTASECGAYLSGASHRLSFFDKNGFPLCDNVLRVLMNTDTPEISAKCGTITPVSYLRQLYTNNVRDSVCTSDSPIKAGISCGSRIIRKLWLDFFDGEDESLIFQVSDDGRYVNAYSADFGFISYEKLVLAYALSHIENNSVLCLPDTFHYAADTLSSESSLVIKRYNSREAVPTEAASHRFLTDPLFMCISLADNRRAFFEVLNKLPKFASAKREVTINSDSPDDFRKTVFSHDGRVYISKSGKNRVTLLAQAYNSETAAELCNVWNEKIRKLSSCNNLFHQNG